MTYTVKELAQVYAEKLVAFYEAHTEFKECSDGEKTVREAREDMLRAHEALELACMRAAEYLK